MVVPIWQSEAQHSRRYIVALAAALGIVFGAASGHANEFLGAALDSITSSDLHRHVEVLADDVYEGRAAGTRGGHAAAQYIVQELRRCRLEPAGVGGDFYQPLTEAEDGRGGRNILALLPGSDPSLEQEIIVVGAHFDHVGRGKSGRSFGPIGEIHNGADDNASGVSVLLETIEALSTTGMRGRRSLIFAFWDSEEVGLVGSKHWFAHPTLPSARVKLAIHADMVGRLREGRLQVLGTRSGFGLRKLMSGPVNDPLWLDFSWELTANSDHWTFLEQEVPVVLLHTGVHDDYHRPSDDVERINADGMREVSRYLTSMLMKAANCDQLPTFRAQAKNEGVESQRHFERVARSPAARTWPSHLAPPRLGITWTVSEAEPGTIILTRVARGTPADAAGLIPLDRIHELDGRAIVDESDFRQRILTLVDSSAAEFTMVVESHGKVRAVTVGKSPASTSAGTEAR